MGKFKLDLKKKEKYNKIKNINQIKKNIMVNL